jgi:hypothetical protein
MRFSMKWILAGMAYVAVAAAAFSQQTWVYADVLWAIGLLAVVYGAIVALFARGRRQAAAAGFVVGSVCFALCVYGSSNSVPTLRLLTAAGIGSDGVAAVPLTAPAYAAPSVSVLRRPVTVETMTPTGPVAQTTYVEERRVMPAPPMPVPTAAPQSAAIYAPYRPPAVVDFSMYIRAGNAVGTMLFGGLGIVLGLAAYKAARRESDHSAANSPRPLTGG